MFNFHPPFAVFPPALLSAVLLLEVLQIVRPSTALAAAARINLLLAALGTIAAFFSGYQASELASITFEVSDGQISPHHSAGRWLLFCVWPCLALAVFSDRALHGRAVFLWSYRLFLVVCWGLVVYTSFLGGELVFSFGAGVKAVPPAVP